MVVSSDAFNRSRIDTITVVPLTSDSRLAAAPGNVLLPAHMAGLECDAVVEVARVTSLDRGRLEAEVATLPRALLQQVDIGLRLALSL